MTKVRKRKVGIAGGEYEATICDLLPANKGRSSLVNAMINAYDFNKLCDSITVKPAKRDELLKFHDSRYVDYVLRKRKIIDEEITTKQREALKKFNLKDDQGDEDEDKDDDDSEQESDSNDTLFNYGLLYDCPIFRLMSKYITTTAGSSISAARYLITESSTIDPETQLIAINWNGGRHHAKKAKASGFCYINDIVLAIIELRKTYEKIMYIDLDLHHGDGVESAFKFSDKVLTFSIHRKDIGFYPGTGSLEDLGKGKGYGYTVNVPIRHGLNDESMDEIIDRILKPTLDKFNPDCIVVQCGVDGLSSDEHQEWNLSIKGFGEQVSKILKFNKPTLLLGGGGYEHLQVARCWTYLTNIALDLNHNFDLIPEHELSDAYEDENFEFWNILHKNMIDDNSKDYINELANIINKRIESW
ncbi:Histone deacetylase 1 [Wickerhamomyces ciferrii]|uniref:Histone deacetylase n=1 Tax=Wickerhamomyces ciferrii (strain ATCC 14091 / BCRC 22168 / CBS 111 / JCM 3599 / NBRC 0793 / NRRL Y-1031 F-60-10) TaxID=1206466 RepID=K0L0I0_WICCF|nr:Histone deacetylase 1 [Wickerhamomyces ciferrii]CCH46943.1 Histone deacetylase 1 [Wickerhamomyces ciferrii]